MNREEGPAEEMTGRADEKDAGSEEARAERSLDEAEREAEELREHLLRAKAEVVNVLKRTEREKAEIARFAIADFARNLLGVADNLRRALEAAPEKLKEDAAARALIEGVEMTERELLSVLERHGVRRIAPQPGERFDHNLHQAMAESEGGEVPPGHIVEVYQPGYMLHDRLLRPAMVTVARGSGGRNGGTPRHVDEEA